MMKQPLTVQLLIKDEVKLTDDDIKVINARISGKSPEKLKYYKDIPFTTKIGKCFKQQDYQCL